MAIETLIQTASLAAHVIEDLTFEPLTPMQYEAALIEGGKPPLYKPEGFFVFTDLRPGDYTLRVSGSRYQTRLLPLAMPRTSLMFYPPGDNELLVTVRSINESVKKIVFDHVVLCRTIRAGSSASSTGFSTKLAKDLEVGRIFEARLESVSGLAAGAIVRIVRDESIRLKFGPYHPLPLELTQIVGRITQRGALDLALEGARVRVKRVNGKSVAYQGVVGARVASIESDQRRIILGTKNDVISLTNERGDYILYFTQEGILQNVTLEVRREGYRTKTTTIAIRENARHRVDVELVKV